MEEKRAPAVVCLGFFDGVHRGHLALIEAAKKAAREENLRLCVHTFAQAPGTKGAELTTLEERKRLLEQAGAQEVAVSVFDDAMRHMSGEEFFQKIVLGQLNARHVICGDDHRFGYRGACGEKELREMCEKAGVRLTVVPQVSLPNGLRISSTAIRQALSQGDRALAEEMLGRKIPAPMKKARP